MVDYNNFQQLMKKMLKLNNVSFWSKLPDKRLIFFFNKMQMYSYIKNFWSDIECNVWHS